MIGEFNVSIIPVSKLFPESKNIDRIDRYEEQGICPECGHDGIVFTGRKTLAFHVDRKAYCPLCMWEEEF